jgi:hypothetical protein
MARQDPIELRGLGKIGIVRDISDHLLVPEAYSNGRNVRFGARGVERMLGDRDAFGELFGGDAQTAEFVMNIPGLGGSFWVYASKNKVYVYEGGAHSNITRQTMAADVDYTAAEGRDWQGTILGGIPIFNNGNDAPQYWTSLNVASKLADLSNWPSNTTAKVMRAFGSYLFAMNLNENGTVLPKGVRWSHFTDPGNIPSSWDYADETVDAGRIELTDDKGGEIVDAMQLGNILCIYTTDSTHFMRFVGGIDIFGSDLLLRDSGAMAGRCVASFAKGTRHCVLTSDDAIIHAGTKDVESILEDKDRKFLFSEIDVTNYKNSFVVSNTNQQEVWLCFPTSGQVYPNLACIWNHRYNTVTFRDIELVSCDTGPFTDAPQDSWDDSVGSWDTDQDPWSTEERKIFVGINRANNIASRLDDGLAFNGDVPLSFVERTGLTVDGMKSGKPTSSIQTRKQWIRIWPKIAGGNPVNVRVARQEYIDGPVVWTDPMEFNPTTMRYLDVNVEGILMGYRIDGIGNTFFRVEGFDINSNIIGDL